MRVRIIGTAGLAALGLAVSGAATARAGPLNPLDFAQLAGSFPSATGTYTIDTSGTTPTLTGPSGSGISISGVLSPDGSTAVFDFGTIAIGAGDTIVVTGPRPVALLAQQGMVVDGAISYSGVSPAIGASPGYTGNGPGGGSPGSYVSTSPGGPFSNGAVGGGGGGGFGGAGGNGANQALPNTSLVATGGAGGGPYGTGLGLFNVLQGGSSGAVGGGATFNAGGGGGGAIELGAVNSITIDGNIHADGGTGMPYNPDGSQGGGGGGSGGGILIDAPTVTLEGTLSAVGGTGGPGGESGFGSISTYFGAGGGGGGGVIAIAVPDAAGFIDQGGTIDVAGAGGGASGVVSVLVVPEPAGLVLAGIGLLPVLVYGRSARRRARG